MQKMGTDDGKGGNQQSDMVETESVGSDRIAYSGPLSKRGGRKSARFNVPDSVGASAAAGDDEQYVEITLDVRDDSVAVHSVKPAAGRNWTVQSQPWPIELTGPIRTHLLRSSSPPLLILFSAGLVKL